MLQSLRCSRHRETDDTMKKRVWAWGVMGSNNLIHTTTMKEHIANDWRNAGLDVRGLVEEEQCQTENEPKKKSDGTQEPSGTSSPEKASAGKTAPVRRSPKPK